MQFLQPVRDRLRRAGCNQDAVDQETVGKFLQRLTGIDGFQKLLDAAEVTVLRAYFISEIGKPHPRLRNGKVDAVLRRPFNEAGFGRYRRQVATLLHDGVSIEIGYLDSYRPQNTDIARAATDRRQRRVEGLPVLFHAGERPAR